MADKGNHNEIAKMTPTELKGEVHKDMTEYFKAEKSHDAAGTATSGERLKDAAVAFEHTLKQDATVTDLAKQIKEGTPGTPAWDKLMETVQKQMEGNNKQIESVQNGIGKTTRDLQTASGEAHASKFYNNLQITQA
jgi:hypothetical protein